MKKRYVKQAKKQSTTKRAVKGDIFTTSVGAELLEALTSKQQLTFIKAYQELDRDGRQRKVILLLRKLIKELIESRDSVVAMVDDGVSDDDMRPEDEPAINELQGVPLEELTPGINEHEGEPIKVVSIEDIKDKDNE